MTANLAEDAVARGAALLDSTCYGWWREIDLDELGMSSHCKCIAGQLGDKFAHNAPTSNKYGNMLLHLGLSYDSAPHYGFNVEWQSCHSSANYDHLEAAWREEIIQRRRFDGEDQ